MDPNPYASPLAEDSPPTAQYEPLKVSFGASVVHLAIGVIYLTLYLLSIVLALLSIVVFAAVLHRQGAWTPWRSTELIVEAMALVAVSLGYFAYRLDTKLADRTTSN